MWTTELNVEARERTQVNGRELADTGGTEVFLSPGFIWTYGRHFQLRNGIQLPIASDLNGDQEETDFRYVLEAEMHF